MFESGRFRRRKAKKMKGGVGVKSKIANKFECPTHPQPLPSANPPPISSQLLPAGINPVAGSALLSQVAALYEQIAHNELVITWTDRYLPKLAELDKLKEQQKLLVLKLADLLEQGRSSG